MKKVSIVLSLFNEEKNVSKIWSDIEIELLKLTDYDFELIWVNDGSLDSTQSIIDQVAQNNVNENISNTSIEFSKNFGHEAAMIAGIDHSEGDVIICMDADGQHPPKKIKEMIHAASKGAEIVLMERIKLENHNLLKKFFSFLFYKTINLLSSIKFHNNSTDFFLISQRVSKILKLNYRDKNRFIRGFIQSTGFTTEILHFKATARTYGNSKYSYLSLFKLAFNAFFAFSFKPLHLSVILSIIFISFTLVLGIYTLYNYFSTSTVPSGYTTILLFLSISFSLLFFTLSILSLYFEKAIIEIRQRPIYIVKNITKNIGA